MKALWPSDKIILICRKGVGNLFLKLQLVDEVFEVQKGQRDSYKKALKNLAQFEIENVIAPHASLRTTLFCQQIKAKRKVGTRNWLNPMLFDETFKKDLLLPDSIRKMLLLTPFENDLKNKIELYKTQGQAYLHSTEGLLSEVPTWASLGLKFYIKSHFASEWRRLLEKFNLKVDADKKRVLIFPGSVWATKRWTLAGFQELGQKLAVDYQVIIMGGPGEENLCNEVAQKIPTALDFSGNTSLLESVLLMVHSDLVIGNDSASTHLSGVAETPSLSFWGPTILNFGYRPWQNKAWILQDEKLSCRPCGPHGHHQCPKKTHDCMKNISAQKAFELAERIIHLCSHQH